MKKIIIWAVAIVLVFSLLWLVGRTKTSNVEGIVKDKPINNVKGVESLNKEQKPAISGLLSVPEIFYDFGKISMKDGDVTKVFTITNNSGIDILFPNLTTSCMCTKAYFVDTDNKKEGPFGMPGMGVVPKLNKTIKAGQSANIEVVYDPNAHGPAGVGMIDRFVYLEDSNGNKNTFEIKAVVTP